MLVGVVDPSHTTRKSDKPGILPPWLTIDELWLTSQTDDTKWSPWTYEMIQAALGEWQERGDRISTTLLVAGCPRGAVLERKVDWVGRLDDMYASLRGTLLHTMLEQYARTGGIAEARFFTTVDDIEFSCSPDLLTEATVYDYKMTENPPTFGYPYRHHTEQLMVNGYVARHAERWEHTEDLPFDPREFPAHQAVVVYLGPKGPKPILVERNEEHVTPGGKVIKKKRPYMWSDSESVDFIRPRLRMMQQALSIFPRWPEGAEDLWGGEPGYDCPGPPLCYLPNCLAKRHPELYTWPQEGVSG